MNDLIHALLQCPNLSLRILDNQSRRTVKTMDRNELQQLVNTHLECNSSCENYQCPNKTDN